MPSTLPRNVREAWGKEVADDFAIWLDERFQQRAVSRDQWREVLSQLDVLEERFDRVDGRLDRIDGRLDRLDGRLGQVGDRIDQVNDHIDQVNDRIDRVHEAMRVQTRWTIGTIALFGTLMTVLLAIAQFGS